ncbi:MAG TPA: Kdo hydroxylase family protein [Bordetella sp.]
MSAPASPTASSMSATVIDLPLRDWRSPDAAGLSAQALHALEQGQVLHFPHLGFALTEAEQALLDPALTDPKRKNISLTPKGLAGTVATGAARDRVQDVLQRYLDSTGALLDALFPGYRDHRHSPATSLRLHAIGTWHPSWRKDDRLLHVDAFPSRPLHGERILRVFTNINPRNEPRTWRVGGSFEASARHYLPGMNKPWRPWLAGLMHKAGITKRRRTEYDHLMLQMHDAMKRDERYQREGDWTQVDFMPGSTWVCFSDQVPHAAMGGQFMLEQTWQLPLAALGYAELAPVRVLEKLAKRPLLAA